MIKQEFEKLKEIHPYLTYIKFQEEDLIGVIQNVDANLVSIYAYNQLHNEVDRKEFLDLACTWWENSNRLIPINIFLRHDFKKFKHTLLCVSRKDVSEIWGYTNNLEDNYQKRIKRKRIQLIKK